MTMAEKKKARTAKKAKPKTAKPAATAKPATRKATRTPARKAAPKRKAQRTSAKPRTASQATSSSGFDIAKLIDHPLVADLLAVGAMAAVAAIADHHVKTRTGEAQSGSSKAVKAAGFAAASAIGKRLMTEVNEVKKAANPEKKSRGSR